MVEFKTLYVLPNLRFTWVFIFSSFYAPVVVISVVKTIGFQGLETHLLDPIYCKVPGSRQSGHYQLMMIKYNY